MSTPGQRAGGNGGMGWVDTSIASGTGFESVAVIRLDRQIETAREALEEIASRGIVVRTSDGCMVNADGTKSPAFRCGACDEDQAGQGPCANRRCLTAIARKALDDMRSAR